MTDDLVGETQSLVETSKKKKVICGKCGSGFSKIANLNQHKETKHAEQTAEIVLKRQNRNAYLKNLRAKQKKNPEKREKLRLQRQSYGKRIKAQKAAQAAAKGGGDESGDDSGDDSDDSDDGGGGPSKDFKVVPVSFKMTEDPRNERTNVGWCGAVLGGVGWCGVGV